MRTDGEAVGYTDEKVRRLTLSSLEQGFNHFKVCLSLLRSLEKY